jgi:hypothetical protein
VFTRICNTKDDARAQVKQILMAGEFSVNQLVVLRDRDADVLEHVLII